MVGSALASLGCRDGRLWFRDLRGGRVYDGGWQHTRSDARAHHGDCDGNQPRGICASHCSECAAPDHYIFDQLDTDLDPAARQRMTPPVSPMNSQETSGVTPLTSTTSQEVSGVTPLLQVSDLLVRREGHLVLDIKSLSVERGEVLAIVGPNGAGKSTFFLVLARLLKADHGQILFNGRALDSFHDLAYRRQIPRSED